MEIYKKITQRTIKFSGAAILIGSLIWYMITAAWYFGGIQSFRITGLVSAYIILALYTEDYGGIGEMFGQVWEIYTNKRVPDEEKIFLIRDFIGSRVAEWDKYWRLFQETTNGYEPITNKLERLKNVFVRIGNGEVSFFQAVWIFGYMVYSIIVASLIVVPIPFDLMITTGLLLVILFTGGSIKGLGKFLEEVFKTLKFEDKKQITSKLRLLENVIMSAAKNYYFISARLDESMLQKQLKEINEYENMSKNLIGEKQ